MSQDTEKIHLNIDFEKNSSFTGRSIEGGLPVTAPLHNLEELLSWSPDDQDDAGQAFTRASVPYNGKNIPEGSTKTLVCHDMAGGYVDDRFVQGTTCSDDKWYYLENWDVVDTFVYFSHHFITIPPVGWINAAHLNNIAVLGTLITESIEGYNRWKAILSSDFLWRFVADKLVEIAKYYKFEGWLLNVENRIKIKDVPTVKDFVQYLTEKIHDAIPKGQVIWYDSVTKDGNLRWQNELNAQNRDFFESCDGIFLNYGWSAKNLQNSVKLAESLSRVQDVYVGIDVFGRGCFGGGGFNSVTALTVIRSFNLSAAIFAPGWVKEVLGGKDFEGNQKIFWNLLSPYCNHHLPLNYGKFCFTSNFASGMSANDKILDRRLDLNGQSQMPCLSENLSLSLPIVPTNTQPYLMFINKNDCVILRTSLPILEGSLVVYCQSEQTSRTAHDPKRFCLKTDIGDCPLITSKIYIEEGSFSINYKSAKKGNDRCYIWCIESKNQAFHLREVVCTDPNKTSMKLHSFAIANIKTRIPPCFYKSPLPKRESQNVIKISVKDVTWGRLANDVGQLLFSGTLILENLLEITPARVMVSNISSVKKDEPKTTFLGSTVCGMYRINQLQVHDPIFHGPDAGLMIEVDQSSTLWFLEPDRYGKLFITYSENTKTTRVGSDDYVFVA